MTRTMLKTLACLIPVILLAPAVQADATLIMKDAGGKTDSVIEVRDHMVRLSTPGESDYMLYDAQRDVAIQVNHSEQTYMEINRDTLAQMATSMAKIQQQMAPQMAQMREQLKNMPPEQRAMIEQQMGGMAHLGAMESKPAATITTVKRGSDKIAGFKCRHFDVMNKKQRIGNVCVATSADAGMSKADFSALRSAMKFMRKMAEGAQKLSAGMGDTQISMGKVDGVPVFAKDIQHGREFRLSSVSNDTLDAARFNEYQSLKRTEMPSMP